MVKSGPLYGPFSGDVKPAPGRKDGENGISTVSGSPAPLATPHKEGVFSYHKGDCVLGVAQEVDLSHSSPKLSSPFTGDMRPGVDSSKK